MALTLKEHFSYSKLETLVINGGYGPETINTRDLYTCVLNCSKDIILPPPEITSIKEIKSIQVEFCTNLNLAETFLMFGDVPNLLKLQMKSCAIQQVPPEIWALYKLRVLNLGNEGYGSNNEFTTFPPEIENLEYLQELNLHDNYHFKRFPPEIAKLKRLTNLSLRGFRVLPENLELIPNLEQLNLVFSHIVPAHIVPLLARANSLKRVTVGEAYFEGFQKLTAQYPTLTVTWAQTSLRGGY